MNKIVKAFSDTPPPPCETCVHFQHCKDQREACGAFVFYARGNDPDLDHIPEKQRVKIPSEKWYNDLFTDFIGHKPSRQGL